MESSGPAQLTRLQNGDEAAFTELVAEYHPRMVALARTIVGESWAEEVVQDAWIAIYRSLPDFAGRSTLRTWLFTIVRNTAITRLRKEGRQLSLDSVMDDAGVDSVEALLQSRFDGAGRWQVSPGHWGRDSADELLEEEQLRHCLDRTISGLGQLQQTVLVMRDREQLDFADICNILDISHSNVRVLLHRARLTLWRKVEKYLETGEC